jgi:hypothetical protein
MRDALDWLAGFFPKYGVRALCLAVVFVVAGWVCAQIAAARPCATWLYRLAGLLFIAFVLMACFYAFKL